MQQDIDRSRLPKGSVRARLFPESCGIGSFSVDVHSAVRGPSPIGTPWKGFATLPFQVPLGALLPKSPTNLIAACKNLGTTHLTSGAYRLHPIEWAIGEAAGALAAFCATQQVAPAAVLTEAGRLAAFQLRLLERGVPLYWWDDVIFEKNPRAFAAIHLLSVRGVLGDEASLSFHPEKPLDAAERSAIEARAGRTFPWPPGTQSRGGAAIWLCGQLGLSL